MSTYSVVQIIPEMDCNGVENDFKVFRRLYPWEMKGIVEIFPSAGKGFLKITLYHLSLSRFCKHSSILTLC